MSLTTQNILDLERRLREEGQQFYTTIAANSQTFGEGVSIKNLPGGVIIYPGWELIPESYNMEASRTLALYMQLGSGSPTGDFPHQKATIGKNEQHTRNHPITEGSSISTIAERFDLLDGDTPFYIRGSVTGTLIYKGWDKKADYTIAAEGDSIMQNAAFLSGSDGALMLGIVREYFCTPAVGSIQRGKIARVINKAKGSGNSTNWIAKLYANKLDFTDSVDLRICMYGTNDVIQPWQLGSSLSAGQITTLINTFITNLTIRVQSHIKRYGTKTKLIILGPPPLYNAVQEAALVQLRNAIKTYVTSIGGAVWNGGNLALAAPDNNIWFGSFGATSTQAGLWLSASGYTNYIEKTGNAVHPNEAGNLLMGNYLTNMFTVNNIK